MAQEPGRYTPKESVPVIPEEENPPTPTPVPGPGQNTPSAPDFPEALEDPLRAPESPEPSSSPRYPSIADSGPPPYPGEARKSTIWEILYSNRGIFCAILSSFTFASTAILVRQLKGYDPMDIALWRCMGVILPSIPLVTVRLCQERGRRNALSEKVKAEEKVWWNNRTLFFLLARSIFSINALFLHFLSLQYIPAGDSVVISSCTPAFAYILAYFLLGEPYGVVPFLTSLLTLFGIVTIVRPPFLTGEEEFDRETLIGSGLALGCTVLTSISFVTLRNVRIVPFSVTALAYGLWGAIENTIIVLINGTFSYPRNTEDWVVAGILGVLAFLGQIVIILALKIEQTGPVSLIRSFDVIFAFLFQAMIMRLIPDMFSFIGAGIVLVNVVITGMRKWVMSLPENDSRRNTYWLLLI